jgi:hypothetical protein
MEGSVAHIQSVLMVLVAAAVERTSGFHHRHRSCEGALEPRVDQEFECRLVCERVAVQEQESALLLVEYPFLIPGLLMEAAVVH